MESLSSYYQINMESLSSYYQIKYFINFRNKKSILNSVHIDDMIIDIYSPWNISFACQ